MTKIPRVCDSKSAKGFQKTVKEMIEMYGWQERSVSPWGYSMKLIPLAEQIGTYENCTDGSKDELKLLANGLIPILEKWEEYENEPEIFVTIDGTKESVKASFYELIKDLPNVQMA